MDNPSPHPPRPWILAALAGIGLLAVGVGGWLSMRGALMDPATTASGTEEPPRDTGSMPEPPAGIKGRKRPEQFGLPSFPTASDFHSLELGNEQGSTAYSVKQGTSAEVARFYIEKLGAAGWQYQWKRNTEARPGDPGTTIVMKGTRVRWVLPKDGRQLTLLTLDDPQGGRSAQAVLSWSPVNTPTRRR